MGSVAALSSSSRVNVQAPCQPCLSYLVSGATGGADRQTEQNIRNKSAIPKLREENAFQCFLRWILGTGKQKQAQLTSAVGPDKWQGAGEGTQHNDRTPIHKPFLFTCCTASRPRWPSLAFYFRVCLGPIYQSSGIQTGNSHDSQKPSLKNCLRGAGV